MQRSVGPGGEAADGYLAAARRGDRRAYDRLIQWCEAEGGRLAQAYSADLDVAQDMWQDALVLAWVRLPGFEGDARGFRAWLMTILVNRCRDQARYDLRHAPVEPLAGGAGTGHTEQPTEPLHLLLDPAKTLDQLLEDGADAERLWAAIASLPEQFQAVLRLHACDYSYAEIAALLGTNTNTVGTRLARAKERVRAYVQQTPDRPEPMTGARP